METTSEKRAGFTRIELWAVITIFVFVMFIFITDALNNSAGEDHAPNKFFFDKARIQFSYFKNYFFPLIIRFIFLFGLFLYLNFVVIPALLEKKRIGLNIGLIGLAFIATLIIYVVTDTYTKAYVFIEEQTTSDAYKKFYASRLLHTFWLLMALGIYTILKTTGVYLVSRAEAIERKYKFFRKEGLYATAVWMMSLFVLAVNEAYPEILVAWGLLVPCAILLYLYSFDKLIPGVLHKKKPFVSYLFRVGLICIAASVLVAFFLLLIARDEEFVFGFTAFNSAFQFLIIAPFSWVVFKRFMRDNEELYVLKKELGRSHANFDFLRSQINPHFLFNALNTIYGTAIQEKAERTSEAIEKLGSMMRFMLQENMQEKISLSREVEYLSDYIELQKLRTDPNPSVSIMTEIQSPLPPVQISPMLLIPFVENAFKHGISLREPSHIKVILEMKEKMLYFDVHNSKHNKPDHDPEKDKSGIGLVNVRQRLQMFYPGRHQLMIRETAKDFFVHLSIQL